jgi:hypothetical protein
MSRFAEGALGIAPAISKSLRKLFAASPARFDHPGDSHAPKWLAALIDEHIGRLRLLLTLQSLETSKLIAFKVVRVICRAFQPADGNGALGRV